MLSLFSSNYEVNYENPFLAYLCLVETDEIKRSSNRNVAINFNILLSQLAFGSFSANIYRSRTTTQERNQVILNQTYHVSYCFDDDAFF